MRPRYTGPYVVLARNHGGAYILCELDGAVLDRPVAQFRVLPYFARHSIEVPEEILAMDEDRLQELVYSHSDGEEENAEYRQSYQAVGHSLLEDHHEEELEELSEDEND